MFGPGIVKLIHAEIVNLRLEKALKLASTELAVPALLEVGGLSSTRSKLV